MADDKTNEWPRHLHRVLYGMRTHVPRATKFSLFHRVYGFIPRMAIDNHTEQNLPNLCHCVIDASQNLLQCQYSHIEGFEMVDFCQSGPRRIGFSQAPTEAIQIHHTQTTQHWVVSSSIGGKVVVVDTLFDTLTDATAMDLCELYPALADDKGVLTVDIVASQKQKGGSDCGLFAIANMLYLAQHGPKKISTIKFDQDRMRNHLEECLMKQQFTAFPMTKKKVSQKGARTVYLDVALKAILNRK